MGSPSYCLSPWPCSRLLAPLIYVTESGDTPIPPCRVKSKIITNPAAAAIRESRFWESEKDDLSDFMIGRQSGVDAKIRHKEKILGTAGEYFDDRCVFFGLDCRIAGAICSKIFSIAYIW